MSDTGKGTIRSAEEMYDLTQQSIDEHANLYCQKIVEYLKSDQFMTDMDEAARNMRFEMEFHIESDNINPDLECRIRSFVLDTPEVRDIQKKGFKVNIKFKSTILKDEQENEILSEGSILLTISWEGQGQEEVFN